MVSIPRFSIIFRYYLQLPFYIQFLLSMLIRNFIGFPTFMIWFVSFPILKTMSQLRSISFAFSFYFLSNFFPPFDDFPVLSVFDK